MVEDFLTNQLTFTVAIGRQDDFVAGPERRGDGLEFRPLIALGGRTGRIKPIRLENGAGPALPGGIDLFGLGKSKEMTLGG